MNESRLLPSLRIVIYRGRRMVAHSVAFDIRSLPSLFKTFEFRASESADRPFVSVLAITRAFLMIISNVNSYFILHTEEKRRGDRVIVFARGYLIMQI